jgi:hypothetical protein
MDRAAGRDITPPGRNSFDSPVKAEEHEDITGSGAVVLKMLFCRSFLAD